MSLKIRVSEVAQVDKNPACGYARIILGLKGKVSVAGLIGTADHLLKVWFNKESARLSYKFRENLSPLEIYDILKDNYYNGVDWAVEQTKKSVLNGDGYVIDDKELILIKNRLLSDALGEAATMSINIGNYRSFWLGYENPNNLHLEESLTVENVEIEGVKFTITSHPDLFMYVPQGDSFMVIDYKTGRPASVSEWINPEHYNQLCGYSFQIKRKYDQDCKLGAVNYTQDVGMWGLRICLLNEGYFIDCLRTVSSWVKGNIPEKTECPYKGEYCTEESKEKCRRFFGE